MLRSRKARREEPLDVRLPDPILSAADGALDPAQEAVLADSVGLALLVVLDTLSPAEPLAVVLPDVFPLPFVGGGGGGGPRGAPPSAQRASRPRRRIRGAAVSDEADLARQREVVAAFLAA